MIHSCRHTALACLLGLLLAFGTHTHAQDGYAFGFKGGPLLGIQNWSDFQRQALTSLHGIAFIESLSDDNAMALFAQLGYHIKGSSLQRRNFFDPTGGAFTLGTRSFRFRNLALTVGAKQKFALPGGRNSWYYIFGIRGDFNVSNNLDEFTDFNLRNPSFAIYPFDDPAFLRRFTGGLTGGAGFEFPFSDLVGGIIEFTINPDLFHQYIQPAIPNVRDPYTGESRTLQERRIRNTTLELSLGIRMLHLIEYLD